MTDTRSHDVMAAWRGRDRFGKQWRGRTVVVVGLAKSGSAAARLLVTLGCHVRVTELSDSAQVRALARALEADGVAQVEVGRHSRALLEGAEVMIVSPGVPETADPIQWALAQGLPVWSEIELAFRFCRATIVAVTGTNGKSSVVTLLERIMKTAGRPAVACGNLGTPFSSVVSSLTSEAIAVVEVSSFQLLRCDQFRPAISVLLNLGCNHLDRHGDRDSYIAAKANIFRRQTPEDYTVLNGSSPEIAALRPQVHAQCVWFGEGQQNPPRLELDPATCRLWPENLQAVLQVARLLDVPDPLTAQVIREFRGLEHRLEPVATIRGVRFVNDSKSTTPDSFLYALRRCPGTVVPILGGRDKHLDFSALERALTDARIRGVVLIGEARPRLRQCLNGSVETREGRSLEEAIRMALDLARPGDAVLFSPACASFDMFRNFEERGQVFKTLVHQLQQGNGHA